VRIIITVSIVVQNKLQMRHSLISIIAELVRKITQKMKCVGIKEAMTETNPLCMICNREFDNKVELIVHLKTHTKKEMTSILKDAVMHHN
jgi:hypothetical protein